MALRMANCGQVRRRHWTDVMSRVEAVIWAERDTEAEENAKETDTSLGFWKRVKAWFWPRLRRNYGEYQDTSNSMTTYRRPFLSAVSVILIPKY